MLGMQGRIQGGLEVIQVPQVSSFNYLVREPSVLEKCLKFARVFFRKKSQELSKKSGYVPGNPEDVKCFGFYSKNTNYIIYCCERNFE
jgi:hypothetical protein